jgi:outer membrane protein TolC
MKQFSGRAMWLTGFLLALFASTSRASETLPLKSVIDSALSTHPKAVEILAIEVQAQGEQLSAAGAFDPVLDFELKDDLQSYYLGHSVQTSVKVPTRIWGLELQANYGLGRGDFPTYEADRLTSNGGALGVGFKLPILRNGSIDSRRFGIVRTRIGLEQARAAGDALRLELVREASATYFSWAAYQKKLAISEQILEIARSRETQFKSRSRAGDLPRMALIDNTRIILKRQQDLIKIRQELREYELKLSLYWRDSEQQPRLPTGQIPEVRDWKTLSEADPVKLAQDRGLWGAPKRPEPFTLGKEVEALQEEVALSRNRILPRLDLKVNANRGFGEGPSSLTAQETKAAVELEVPFFFREGRGRLSASQSKLIRTEAKLRLEKDRIGTEIAAVQSRFLNRREEWQLAQQEFELARQLESIERRSFAEGHSNLIDVNIREETAAGAGVRVAEAEAALATSWVDYWVSLGSWRDIPLLLP